MSSRKILGKKVSKRPSRKEVGQKGEDLAAKFLADKGYEILARNFRADHAEVDIICRLQSEKEEVLIFVEVKTRTSLAFGTPIAAVTESKIKHLQRAALHYMHENDLEDCMCRFDVIGVVLKKGKSTIEHVEDILDY